MKKFAILLLCAFTVTGCSSWNILESKKIDYKSSGKLPPLEIPPDLSAINPDDRYTVPDINPQGSATFSAYNQDRAGKPAAGRPNLLPGQDNARIERAGSERWLVVNAAPEKVWPLVKEFWQELGFIINIEKPEAGILETDWAENRAKIPQDPIRNVLSKVIDSLYSTAERDKFRTRLEAGKEAGTTEIYISHRGMYEVLEGGDGGKRTIWEPRPADPGLEAEMLRRLMVRFGVEEARAASLLAAKPGVEQAKLNRATDGQTSLSLFEPFDRAWRRVGLALDRVGFTVEDRDRSSGLYYVRYVDPETDTKKETPGFLSKLLFWRSDKAPASSQQQYRIKVSEVNNASQVMVLDKSGSAEKSNTGNKILGLLYEQLK